jgi:hypothetical protein
MAHGYRTLRITHRRLEHEASHIAARLKRVLAA